MNISSGLSRVDPSGSSASISKATNPGTKSEKKQGESSTHELKNTSKYSFISSYALPILKVPDAKHPNSPPPHSPYHYCMPSTFKEVTQRQYRATYRANIPVKAKTKVKIPLERSKENLLNELSKRLNLPREIVDSLIQECAPNIIHNASKVHARVQVVVGFYFINYKRLNQPDIQIPLRLLGFKKRLKDGKWVQMNVMTVGPAFRSMRSKSQAREIYYGYFYERPKKILAVSYTNKALEEESSVSKSSVSEWDTVGQLMEAIEKEKAEVLKEKAENGMAKKRFGQFVGKYYVGTQAIVMNDAPLRLSRKDFKKAKSPSPVNPDPDFHYKLNSDRIKATIHASVRVRRESTQYLIQMVARTFYPWTMDQIIRKLDVAEAEQSLNMTRKFFNEIWPRANTIYNGLIGLTTEFFKPDLIIINKGKQLADPKEHELLVNLKFFLTIEQELKEISPSAFLESGKTFHQLTQVYAESRVPGIVVDENLTFEQAFEHCQKVLEKQIQQISSPFKGRIDRMTAYLEMAKEYKTAMIQCLKAIRRSIREIAAPIRRPYFRLIKQINQGLSFLHGQGIIHRDIKPQNICLEEIDDKWGSKKLRVRLIDFDKSVRVFQNPVSEIDSTDPHMVSQVDRLSRICMTPQYGAPECFRNIEKKYFQDFSLYATTAQDIWSAGLVAALIAGVGGWGHFYYRKLSELLRLYDYQRIQGDTQLKGDYEAIVRSMLAAMHAFEGIRESVKEKQEQQGDLLGDFFREVFRFFPKNRLTANEVLRLYDQKLDPLVDELL